MGSDSLSSLAWIVAREVRRVAKSKGGGGKALPATDIEKVMRKWARSTLLGVSISEK